MNIDDYLQGSNKKDLEKLDFLVSESKIDMRNFGVVSINLKEFSWLENDSPIADNNFWWQVQGFIFFTYFLNSHSLLSDEKKRSCFLFLLDIVKNWKKRCFDTGLGKLLWHDHATGLRTLRLAKFYIIGKLCGFISEEEGGDLKNVIFKHFDILVQDSFYSKNTNHGFDQSISAYAACLLLNDSDPELTNVFSSRIIAELDFAFTDEGVHVENSPSYQSYMLGKEKVLDRLIMIGDKNVQNYKNNIFQKARLFLEAITKIDGFLPTIGDTDAKEVGLKNRSGEIVHHDYSASGYYIYKKNKEENTYLAIKNCHFSKYHRHDDNGSFYLEIQGVVVFGDGGLGHYKEKDPRRKFLRSVYAHNVIFSKNGKIYRDPKKITDKGRPRMIVDERKVSCFFSDSQGGFQRSFDLSDIDANKLTIVDRWDSNREVSCNFFFPHEEALSVFENGEGFLFLKDKIEVSVSVVGGSPVVFSSNDLTDFFGEELNPCFSPSYSVFQPCGNVIVDSDGFSRSMTYILSWRVL